jgi:hypothetical protein
MYAPQPKIFTRSTFDDDDHSDDDVLVLDDSDDDHTDDDVLVLDDSDDEGILTPEQQARHSAWWMDNRGILTEEEQARLSAPRRAHTQQARPDPDDALDTRKKPMTMIPLVDTDGREGVHKGDRILYKGDHYTVVVMQATIFTMRPDSGADVRLYLTNPAFEIVGPRRPKLDLVDFASVGSSTVERVIFVDPLTHTTDQDRRMLFLLHGMGYRVASRKTREYESFREFVAQTVKDNLKDQKGSFCAAPGVTLAVPTKWFLKTLAEKHILRSEKRYRYYYIAVCFGSGDPLSAAIYGYNSVGAAVEIVAICSNQRTLRDDVRARGTGKQLIRDITGVCDRMGTSMKVESVVASVEFYMGLGFRVVRLVDAGPQTKSVMVRDVARMHQMV